MSPYPDSGESDRAVSRLSHEPDARMRHCCAEFLTEQSDLRYLFGTMRYCVEPGCPAKVKRGRCEKHRGQHHRRDREARGSAAQRGYDAEWRRIREQKLRTDPLCEPCAKQDRATEAVEVDHLTPLSRGGTHAWGNLSSTCRTCHRRKTVRENRR